MNQGKHVGFSFSIVKISGKKALGEQCKEIEENNTMGKTRSLQESWRYQGTLHAKMGTMKDRNSKDLTEAEEIKKRWQEYTEELYKKELHDPDNHDGVIDHSPRARHPGMQNQVAFKHHYKQS